MHDLQAERGTTIKQRFVVGVGALAILLLDQVTKTIALHTLVNSQGLLSEVRIFGEFLSLRLAFNSGAAFSVATHFTIGLSLFSIVVAAFILRRSRNYTDRRWILGAQLISGGIAGNLADRLFRAPTALSGRVVDWIHIWHWPTFNLADTSIVIGAALIAVLTLGNIPAKGEVN